MAETFLDSIVTWNRAAGVESLIWGDCMCPVILSFNTRDTRDTSCTTASQDDCSIVITVPSITPNSSRLKLNIFKFSQLAFITGSFYQCRQLFEMYITNSKMKV